MIRREEGAPQDPESIGQDQLEEVWGDPWQHARLLADLDRTRGLVDFLARHAPGRRVVEIGCGTGLLSCIAARMGATSVVGIEPTRRHVDAKRLVQASGLQDKVRILHGRVEDFEPSPADLVFSELLNADPFAEGVVPAMRAGAGWLAPGGLLAPAELELHVALVAAADVDAEATGAAEIVEELGRTWNLNVRPLLETLEATPARTTSASWVELRSAPVLALRVPLGVPERHPESVELELVASQKGRVCGAVIWFSARYDDQLVLANPPQEPGHWGLLVTCWPRAMSLEEGAKVRVRVDLREIPGVAVVPA